jgi:hypothetical protein
VRIATESRDARPEDHQARHKGVKVSRDDAIRRQSNQIHDGERDSQRRDTDSKIRDRDVKIRCVFEQSIVRSVINFKQSDLNVFAERH